jgi:hypothetical protein
VLHDLADKRIELYAFALQEVATLPSRSPSYHPPARSAKHGRTIGGFAAHDQWLSLRSVVDES